MRLSSELKQQLSQTFADDYEFVLKGMKFAERKHRGSTRDDGTPYFWHPLRVAEYSRQFKHSKNATLIYVAALLHDTLEDTYTSYREIRECFGEEVASIVMELSTAKYAQHLDGKAIYLSKKMTNMTSYALYIKLCDRLDNIRTLNTYTEEKRNRVLEETTTIMNYIKKNANLNDSHKRLIDAIEEEIKKY